MENNKISKDAEMMTMKGVFEHSEPETSRPKFEHPNMDDDDIPAKFWKEYKELDFIDRQDKIKPIVDLFLETNKIKDEKVRRHMILLGLTSYFEDLVETFAYNKN